MWIRWVIFLFFATLTLVMIEFTIRISLWFLIGVVISGFFLIGFILKWIFSSPEQSGGSESSLDNY
jgi:hypothetical protein